jgi:cytochrome oxidase assembly protein ShyY1
LDSAAVVDNRDLRSAVHLGQPNNHLSYALNWFSPGQIEVIMLALLARKALKP